jgi:hypothetical protein
MASFHARQVAHTVTTCLRTDAGVAAGAAVLSVLVEVTALIDALRKTILAAALAVLSAFAL